MSFFSSTLLAPAFAPLLAAASPYRTSVRPRSTGAHAEQRALDGQAPGFATRVTPGETPGVQLQDDLPQLLARTPGLTVRTLGGLGQFSSVSVRGAAPEQTAWFLDGTPLDSSQGGLADASAWPLLGVQHVDIYRGFVPVTLGGRTVGGAIDVRSTASHASTSTNRVEASAGGGSFGARSAHVGIERNVRSLRVGVHAGMAGAQGDFSFSPA